MATKRYVTGGMGARPGFGATSIGGGGLTDVDITNPQPEDVLTYDGSDWVNRQLSWKEPVLTLFNPTTALPSSPTNGDRYISTATANGWTINHIYTYNGLTGTADAAVTSTNTTLKDTRLSMTADEYVGMVITCNGKTMTVTSNNGNTFTGTSWSGGGNPGNGNSWAGVLWTDIAPAAGMMIWATVLRQLYEYDNTAFYWRPFPDTYLKPVISIYDNTTALPVTPLPGDRYIAMTTGNGWQKDYVYEWDNVTGNGWVELYPLEGSMIFISELGNFFVYDNGAWVQYPVTWQDPVISIFDNTSALPVAPADGDRYIAMVTANGWTIDYIYEWNSLNWVGTAPVIGMFVFNNDDGAPYLYTGAAWTVFNPLTAHALGGPMHSADSVTNLKSKISGPDYIITSQAGEINSLTAKGVPTMTDQFMIEDAADSNKKKKILISNLPAATPAAHAIGGAQHSADSIANIQSKLSSGKLITTDAAEISTVTVKATPTTSDLLLIEDAADLNNKKRMTIGTLPAATPASHAFAGAQHSTSQIAAIQSQVGDGSLITSAAGEIDALTEKVTPVDGDAVMIEDSEDSFAKKKMTLSSMWAVSPSLSWKEPVISIFDNTSALPSSPSVGDRYIALVTANGWTANHIYECTAA